MSDFYILLAENVLEYAILVIFIFSVVYFLFRKHIYSIFDPLLYVIVFTDAFCIANVVFMWSFNLIDAKYFFQYMVSEFALLVGIFLMAKKKITEQGEGALLLSRRKNKELKAFFSVSLVLYVGLNLIVYATAGIPVFMENRLVVYQVGGGFGIISRVLDVLLVVIVYYLIEVYQEKGWRPTEWIVLTIVATILALSGAKSAVLTLVFIVSLHAFYTGAISRNDVQLIKLLKRLTIVAVVAFLIIAQLQIADIEIAGRSLNVFDQAILRFVNNGDAFLYAYPNGVVDQLDSSNPFGALFREYLAAFRILAPGELPMHVGLQLSKHFNGLDAITQTNAKHNIFGYVSFGVIGGIIYSFLLGLCIGVVRNNLFSGTVRSYLFGIPYIILNLGFVTAANDFDNSSRAVLNVIFVYVPLLIMTMMLKFSVSRKNDFE